jgi:hypothetical protein
VGIVSIASLAGLADLAVLRVSPILRVCGSAGLRVFSNTLAPIIYRTSILIRCGYSKYCESCGSRRSCGSCESVGLAGLEDIADVWCFTIIQI